MSSLNPDTWMPFYMGDFEASTTSLSHEEKWGYLKVIFEYWRLGHKGKKIVFDEKSIKIIAKISNEKAKKILAFFENQDGYLFHQRIEKEIKRTKENKEVNTERAKKAAEARWGKRDAPSIPRAKLEDVLQECPPPPHTSVTNVTGETPSKKKYYFDKWIEQSTAAGIEERSARSFLGRQIKDFGELKVFAALDTLGGRDIADLNSYLLEVLRTSPEPEPPRLEGKELLVHKVGVANWKRSMAKKLDPGEERQLEAYEKLYGTVTWINFDDWKRQQK